MPAHADVAGESCRPDTSGRGHVPSRGVKNRTVLATNWAPWSLRCVALCIVMLTIVHCEMACDNKEGFSEESSRFLGCSESNVRGPSAAECQRARQEAEQLDNSGKIVAYERSILTKTKPAFVISVHPLEYDPLQAVWGITDRGTYYDEALTRVARVYLHGKPTGIVLDIGSNIGWLSLYAAAMGHEVFSFEPNPLNIVRQCQALALNSFAAPYHVVGMAVGDEELTGQSMTWNYHAVTATLLPPKLDAGVKVMTLSNVTVTTIDAFLAREEMARGGVLPISLLKIDVEGFEPMVIKGAMHALKGGAIHAIYMEMSPLTEPAVSWRKSIEILLDAGFQLVSMSYKVEMQPSSFVTRFNRDHDIGLLLFRCVSKPDRQCDLLWDLKPGPHIEDYLISGDCD